MSTIDVRLSLKYAPQLLTASKKEASKGKIKESFDCIGGEGGSCVLGL